jgi:3-oxoacyl-[acyl-carrier protein] reductase
VFQALNPIEKLKEGSGVIDTPLAKALGTAEQINDRLLSRTALKRIAQPEEVSRVILFLLSEVSSYITSSVRLS